MYKTEEQQRGDHSLSYKGEGKQVHSTSLNDNRASSKSLHQLQLMVDKSPRMQTGQLSNQTTSIGVMQRKGGGFPSVSDIEKISSGAMFNIGKYDAVLIGVRLYNEMADDDNYGTQLVYLNEISKRLNLWETGASNKSDKRKAAIKEVKTKTDAETQIVQIQALNKAQTRQQQESADLHNKLKAGSKSSSLSLVIRNTCEFLLSSPKVKVFAATQTGDNEVRLGKDGKSPVSHAAFFPFGSKSDAGDIHSTGPATYDTNPTENDGVRITTINNPAWAINSDSLVITNPKEKGENGVLSNLVHEGQHLLDRHAGIEENSYVTEEGERPGPAVTDDAKKSYNASKQLQNYKTEFRAYSLQIQEGFTDGIEMPQDKTVAEAIRDHIMKFYPEIKEAWEENNVVTGPGKPFQDCVNEYTDFTKGGFNPTNSPRVDEFYESLDAVGLILFPVNWTLNSGESRTRYGTPAKIFIDSKEKYLNHVKSKFDALIRDEREFVLNSEEYKKKVHAHFEQADAIQLWNELLIKGTVKKFLEEIFERVLAKIESEPQNNPSAEKEMAEGAEK